MSRGQERRYSRGRSLDGIHDADRLMQRENAKLVIAAASSIRFDLISLSTSLSLSLFLCVPLWIDSDPEDENRESMQRGEKKKTAPFPVNSFWSREKQDVWTVV